MLAAVAVPARAQMSPQAGAPEAGGGQPEDASPLEMRLHADLEALLPDWREARERLRVADSIRALETLAAELRRTRTLEIGGTLRVVVAVEQRAKARDIMGAAWGRLEPLVGSAPFRDVVVHFDHSRRARRAQLPRPGHIRHVDVHVRPWLSEEQGVRIAVRQLAGALGPALPPNVRRVTAGRVLDTNDQPEKLYRLLLTGGSSAGRDCYRGDLERCWAALGATDGEPTWRDWYSEAELRRLVAGQSYTRGEHLAAQNACVFQDDLDACVRILGDPVPPFTGPLAVRLVQRSLERGGAGSYQRLVEDTAGSLREQLARTAGIPAETLIADWREEILAAQPDAYAGVGRARWPALIWVVILAAMAMRSTRWRLG